MTKSSNTSKVPGQVVGAQGATSFRNHTVVLLEDNQDQIDSVRRTVEGFGFELLAAPDWRTIVLLAEAGVRFFVLDIKTGEGEGRVKAGLDALQVLRSRYGSEVFVAVLTALKKQHENAIKRQRADIAVEKSHDTKADIESIVAEWSRWVGQEGGKKVDSSQEGRKDLILEAINPDSLFPSDALARQIAGATRKDLVPILRERRRIAQALGEVPPRYDDLVGEIGERMRDELRGALVEIADRARLEGVGSVELARGSRLSGDLARLVFRFLPITYGGDDILLRLAKELHEAAAHDFSGEWGTVKLLAGRVVLNPMDEPAYE